MERKNLIKLLYLYLFSLVGLVLIVIGSVQIINLGLTTWVFTQADEVIMYPSQRPLSPEFESEREVDPAEEEKLEKERVEYMERERTSRRQRTAASALAMIIVGAPLYLYHWRSIRGMKS